MSWDGSLAGAETAPAQRPVEGAGDARADTIFAPATARGRAGVAIIRVSGPRALDALRALSGRTEWRPRVATRVRLRSARGETLDDGLALYFPEPASFTGEDVAELHLHGGPAVVAAVLETLAGEAGLRPAGPGEFTRRAFDNGKLDLTQVEALADLIAAETAAQRRQALRQLDGALGRDYERWRQTLLRAMARLEATIDFADEDLPTGLEEAARADAVAVRNAVTRHLAAGERGRRIRDGFTVVLMGAPNAGKSSLLNALARREAAIVDAAPGTTRDPLEVPADVAGLPVVFVDTAGLRDMADADGRVEREGIRRALARAADADLRIAVFDGALWPAVDGGTVALLDGRTIAVISKGDLGRAPAAARVAGWDAVVLSAHTGAGVDELLREVGRRVQSDGAGGAAGEGEAWTRLRHRRELEACRDALDRCAAAAASETAAEELRAAAAALGRLTGRVDIEEVLDALFGEFCIGK